EVGKIGSGHGSAERLRGAEYCLRNLTFVVGGDAVLRNGAQGFCEIRIAEELADGGHFAVGQIHPFTFRVMRENLRSVTPESVNEFGDWIAVIGVKDRRTEELFPCKLSEAIMERVPSRDRTGNGDRVNGIERHLGRALGLHVFKGQSLRGPST